MAENEGLTRFSDAELDHYVVRQAVIGLLVAFEKERPGTQDKILDSLSEGLGRADDDRLDGIVSRFIQDVRDTTPREV